MLTVGDLCGFIPLVWVSEFWVWISHVWIIMVWFDRVSWLEVMVVIEVLP